ncbi:hypothetical protein [Klebsiella variicola]|uniref:T6SS phospholipase effector Tle1-like catalytic domain-containing protein n=1 Tax=Klebsiella variicola TaxID=244366 RepID=UPI0039F57FF6
MTQRWIKPSCSTRRRSSGKDYHDGYRIPDNLAQLVLDTVLQPVIFVLNTDDEAQEYRRMKRDGEARVAVTLSRCRPGQQHEQPARLVRTLFDDQVHDSRAWFMYTALWLCARCGPATSATG